MKSFECPAMGYRDTEVVTLAHGSGGEAMQRIIGELFAKEFHHLEKDEDAAIIDRGESFNMAFTTDSFVVDPIFFPGGDIGSLSIHGTVNDLASRGAVKNQYITSAFIIEEGFPMNSLRRIVASMAKAAERSGAKIVSGDTKVIERSHKNPGIFINTSGVGSLHWGVTVLPSPHSVIPRSKIIISGDIGRHGMAIMSVRNGLTLETPILSDSAPINGIVNALYDTRGITPLCIRDATRGGVAAVLNEIARVKKIRIQINEDSIPVEENVAGLAEILGLDPLHIANEGRFVLFVPENQAEHAVSIIRNFPNGERAAIIGGVVGTDTYGLVTGTTLLGSEKIIQMPEGEILPRIC